MGLVLVHALYQVCIINLHHFKSVCKKKYDSNPKIYCDLNRNESSQVTEWLFYRYRSFNFSTVTDLSILLKQHPATVFSWKLYKIFRTDIFYVTPPDGCSWIYRQFSLSSCPLFPALVCRDKRERRVNQFRILCYNNALRICKYINTIQLNSNRCLANIRINIDIILL